MTVQLPSLWKWQQEVHDHPARFKVLSVGRRAGKSHLSKYESLNRAINHGASVWLVFPSYTNADDHWTALKRMVGQPPWLASKNEVRKTMRFSYHPRGGSLSLKSADKPENLRGSGLDYVVMDEAAFMQEDVWVEVISPMLLDTKGEALFISTPYGQNWFYKIFLLGEDPTEDEYASWKLPSWVNPNITKAEIEKQKRRMPRSKFAQEVLADFVASAGGAFTNVTELCTLTPLVEPDPAGVYYAGIDWGRKNDKTVVSIFDAQTGNQVFLDAFTDIGFNSQADRIERILRHWHPSRVYVEENSIGAPMLEQLKTRMKASTDIRLRGVYMTNKIKRDLVERMITLCEHERIRFLSDDTEAGLEQRIQLVNYTMKRTRGGQEVTYSAPAKQHDDCVVAAMLAVSPLRVKSKAIRTFQMVPNPFYT